MIAVFNINTIAFAAAAKNRKLENGEPPLGWEENDEARNRTGLDYNPTPATNQLPGPLLTANNLEREYENILSCAHETAVAKHRSACCPLAGGSTPHQNKTPLAMCLKTISASKRPTRHSHRKVG